MKYLNALNSISGVGSQKLTLLMSYFPSAQSAWVADFVELEKSGITAKIAENIVKERAKMDVDELWARNEQAEIKIITIKDADYPPLLKHIHNPPYLLYIRGDASVLGGKMLAIVGSRNCTSYGLHVAKTLSHELAGAGIIVVSGLALGIDAESHRGTLAANGLTVAVLGSSVDRDNITPRSNANLGDEIIANGGAIISEHPVPTPPTNGSFPARNRIMAGMTAGTIVIEAAEGSGSLITANHALENGREVFAVPGSILSPQSFGTHFLLKNGAKIVTCANDILEEFSLGSADIVPPTEKREFENKEHQKIYETLSSEPVHVDRIIKLSKLETSTVISALSILEMQGAVKDMGGHNFIRL